MTPRQRVRAVLNRRTADRVPIDCGGTDVTGLHGSAYNALKAHLGIDVLNPVQVSARNMDSAVLKAEFGREIIFWGGGCDTQRVLPRGTVDEVREEVKRRVGDLVPEGGFVFAQVHNIQPGVPPENIVAMFDAALEFSGY